MILKLEMGKELQRITGAAVFLGIIFVLAIFTLFFFRVRPAQIEDYCMMEAVKGDSVSAQLVVKPTAEEVKQMKGLIDPNGMITLALRKQLQCERKQKRFFLF